MKWSTFKEEYFTEVIFLRRLQKSLILEDNKLFCPRDQIRLNGVALQSCQNLCKFGKIYTTCVFEGFLKTEYFDCVAAEIKLHVEQIQNT